MISSTSGKEFDKRPVNFKIKFIIIKVKNTSFSDTRKKVGKTNHGELIRKVQQIRK